MNDQDDILLVENTHGVTNVYILRKNIIMKRVVKLEMDNSISKFIGAETEPEWIKCKWISNCCYTRNFCFVKKDDKWCKYENGIKTHLTTLKIY